jgi:hypothetical protein
MLFLETPVFTRQIKSLIDDDAYLQLQAMLMARPDAGELIQGSGGLRKVRMGLSGRGKRSGARVIYYWMRDRACIFMLLAYAKNDMADLGPAEIRMLAALVEEELE